MGIQPVNWQPSNPILQHPCPHHTPPLPPSDALLLLPELLLPNKMRRIQANLLPPQWNRKHWQQNCVLRSVSFRACSMWWPHRTCSSGELKLKTQFYLESRKERRGILHRRSPYHCVSRGWCNCYTFYALLEETKDSPEHKHNYPWAPRPPSSALHLSFSFTVYWHFWKRWKLYCDDYMFHIIQLINTTYKIIQMINASNSAGENSTIL